MNFYDPFNLFHAKKEFLGEPPGTINYTGKYNDVPVTIELIQYNVHEYSKKTCDAIETVHHDDYIYWYNITGLHNTELIKNIGTILNIHHMDLEDIVHVSQWSKIEDQEDYLFSIFKMIYLNNEDIVHEHVSIILTDNLILTFQETPGDVFDEVRDRLSQNKGRIRQLKSDYLYYSLLDAIIDPYFSIINRISTDYMALEMAIIENAVTSKEKIYHLRKELVYLSNAILPIRDQIDALRKKSVYFSKAELQPYYGDLIEHMHQINDALKAYKEMINSLQEMQMSNISDDMNKTMMTLTIFSAVFIPLSFLAGIFGMNFTHIPGLSIYNAFYWFLGGCLLIAGGMLSFFKWKKWF
ncbi:MAG: magnesium/cobalt transporter CorA [Clostridia bacterium]|nr:magnesium/cobalt transporter CorA [Clostridia bacterium]